MVNGPCSTINVGARAHLLGASTRIESQIRARGDRRGEAEWRDGWSYV